MRKPALALASGLVFLAAQTAAFTASAAASGVCLQRHERESAADYSVRVRDACQAEWNGVTPVRPSTGAAYERYMKSCEKPCLAVAHNYSTGLLIGALAVAGAAGAAAASSGGSHPASP